MLPDRRADEFALDVDRWLCAGRICAFAVDEGCLGIHGIADCHIPAEAEGCIERMRIEQDRLVVVRPLQAYVGSDRISCDIEA